MPQTLFTLAAIVTFSLYAFGRHQTDHDVERRSIAIETELAATDVASARVAELLQLAWDEDDVDGAGLRRTPPTSGLGPDGDEASPSSFDDIDDYHGHTETRSVDLGAGALTFTVRITVAFVDPVRPDTPSPVPTLAKEVRIRVDEVAAVNPGRPPATADLRRVVTPTGL